MNEPCCQKCGGPLMEVDEIRGGWNGALGDEGTGYVILVCEDCGTLDERPESRRFVGC